MHKNVLRNLIIMLFVAWLIHPIIFMIALLFFILGLYQFISDLLK